MITLKYTNWKKQIKNFNSNIVKYVFDLCKFDKWITSPPILGSMKIKTREREREREREQNLN